MQLLREHGFDCDHGDIYYAKDRQRHSIVIDATLMGERLIVHSKDGSTTQARLGNTSHVASFGNVHVTSPALRALLDRNIPTLFFTYGGWYQGRTIGADSKNVELRLAQYDACQSEHFGLKLARGFVASKILNCRTLLRRNHAEPSETVLSELKQLGRKARNADNVASLLGIEGTAARVEAPKPAC